jgi:hypothetical protein
MPMSTTARTRDELVLHSGSAGEPVYDTGLQSKPDEQQFSQFSLILFDSRSKTDKVHGRAPLAAGQPASKQACRIAYDCRCIKTAP